MEFSITFTLSFDKDHYEVNISISFEASKPNQPSSIALLEDFSTSIRNLMFEFEKKGKRLDFN